MSTDDVYKTPEAEILVDNSDSDEFFAVSTTKLWIMHALTMGLYDVYWFYRHWDHMKLKRNLSVSPALRGFFYIFFIYSTLAKIDGAGQAKQLGDRPNLKLTALYWYIVYLGSFCAGIVMGWYGIVDIFLALAINVTQVFLSGFFITAAQGVANRVIDDPEGAKNSRITAANIAWIVLGLLVNFSQYFVA